MKKIIKGLLVGLCCLCMNTQAQISGQCGNNAWWEYKNDTLRVRGSGGTWDMRDHGVMQPWFSFREQIKVIIVENGITNIADRTFVDMNKIEHVELPSTLRGIGHYGITSHNLKSIILPENLQYISKYGIGYGGTIGNRMDAMVSLNTTPPIIGKLFGYETFHDLDKNIKIYVPGSTLPAYREAEGWKEFGEIIPLNTYDGVFRRITKLSMVDSIECYEGETVQLTANIEPANATLKLHSWESSDTSIIDVSDNGLVTLKSDGEAKVIVKTVDGGFRAETTVKVTRTKVRQIEILNTNKEEYDRGEKIKITYKVSPETALNKNVSFSSSNPEVASVDTTGLVQCIRGGETTITVTTEEGGFTDKINITVKKYVNDNLKSLDLNFDIIPAFNINTYDYFATVGGDVKSASIVAEAEDEYATITSSSNKELRDGENNIVMKVAAEDKNYTKTYFFHVYRQSAEARLKSLTVNQGTLEPAFSPDRKEYIWRVTKKGPYLNISTVPMHDKASVSTSTVGSSYTKDQSFLILTTAEDYRYGEKYTVKVEEYEDNAHLKDLKVEGFELKPEFQKSVSVYDVTVPNTTKEVNVIAVPDDPNATISGETGWQRITGAEMLFTINVLAEDRISHRAYQIRVQKEALVTDIEKVEGVSDERVRIYTVDGRYLGVTEKVNNKIKAPNWLIKGTFIAVGSKYREKFTN